MRSLVLVFVFATFFLNASSVSAADDAVAECKNFFAKFQTCIDGLEGEQKDEATIFMKTLRGTLGMSDDLNQGDPTLLGIMCGTLMEEAKKDPDIQKYKCQW